MFIQENMLRFQKAGMCPHGGAQSSCSLCQAAAGSGNKKSDSSSNKTMSYSEGMSYMINLSDRRSAVDNIYRQLLDNAAQNAAKNQNIINTNSILFNLITILKTNILKFDLLNIFDKLKSINKEVKEKFDVKSLLDRLAAIYGEQTESIKKNIERFKEKVKEKFGLFFFDINELFKDKKDNRDQDTDADTDNESDQEKDGKNKDNKRLYA